MPRGPGKKENYNLDYARFSKFDHIDEDENDARRTGTRQQDDADAAGGKPPADVQEILQNLPPELQEAYRLMAIAKASGDEAAERRAGELAIAAVQKGSPQIKREFIQNMAQQMPDMADRLTKEMNNQGPEADPAKVLDKISAEMKAEESRAGVKSDGPAEVLGRVDHLQEKMKAGAESARRQMEAMEKQQQQLEKISSPEDFFKFMHQGGMSEQDLQRCFAGDQAHMEACMSRMLEGAINPEQDTKLADAEQATKAVEQIHGVICGDGVAEPSETPPNEPKPAPKPIKNKVEEPEVKIPEYRLQYGKDDDGKYTSVELKCALPGVASMDSIVLDVAEKHIRLSTVDPAPRYVVNAGPFPVLIDAEAARAKYSKKRGELSVTVPARAAR